MTQQSQLVWPGLYEFSLAMLHHLNPFHAIVLQIQIEVYDVLYIF